MIDYHTHTAFSDDSDTPMERMLDAAVAGGLTEIAVTDHYDPDYPDRSIPFELEFAPYHHALETACQRYGSRITIRKGIEIGIQHGETLQKCSAAAAAYPYDFIIGSFHAACGEDFCSTYMEHRTKEEGVRDYYEYMLHCLQQYNDFDVLGHLNVIDRYVPSIPDYTPYRTVIHDILSLLVSRGKGIEINTSSWRYGLGDRTTPTLDMLKEYVSLGGRIVTIGSDAHVPQYIAEHYSDAVAMLQAAGLTRIAVFQNRQVDFLPI